jgi:hypothetical protein
VNASMPIIFKATQDLAQAGRVKRLALSRDRRAAVSHLLPRRFWTCLDTSRHAIRASAQARTT